MWWWSISNRKEESARGKSIVNLFWSWLIFAHSIVTARSIPTTSNTWRLRRKCVSICHTLSDKKYTGILAHTYTKDGDQWNRSKIVSLTNYFTRKFCAFFYSFLEFYFYVWIRSWFIGKQLESTRHRTLSFAILWLSRLMNISTGWPNV